jgi:hypothetical protein
MNPTKALVVILSLCTGINEGRKMCGAQKNEET